MSPTDNSTPDQDPVDPVDPVDLVVQPVLHEIPGKATPAAPHTGQWREPFTGIQDFVDHAKKSADIQPVVYALNTDR